MLNYDCVDDLPQKYRGQAKAKLEEQQLHGQLELEFCAGKVSTKEVEVNSRPREKRKKRLVVHGKPQPKERAIVNTYSKKAYTPDATAAYEKEVARQWKLQNKNTTLQGPLKMTLLMCFAVPKSDSKKKRQQKLDDEIKHTIRPDASNVLKAIEDGLNGVAYHDDSQLVEIYMRKMYAEEGYVVVELEEI